MPRFSIIAIFCLLLPSLSSAQPLWVKEGKSPAFPEARYLTGVGVSKAQGEDADKKREAEDEARAEIARIVKSDVKTIAMSSARETVGVSSEETVSSFVQSVSDVSLEGVKISETYLDSAAKVWYAFAVLDRAEAEKRYSSKAGAALAEAAELAADGRSKAAEVDSALKSYIAARRKLLEAEQAKLVHGVVKAASSPPLSLAGDITIRKLDAEVEKLFAAAPKTLDNAVLRLAYGLGENVEPGMTVMLDRFTYQDTKFGSTLADYLGGAMDSELASTGGFKMVDRKRLTQVAAEAGGQAVNFGKLVSADSILWGNYWEKGDAVRLNAYLTSVATAEKLASATAEATSASIASAKLAARPDNFDRLKEDFKLLEGEKMPESDLKVEVWTDRGPSGAIYREGEQMRMYVRANRRCYLKILYHQADGTDVLVFPNKYSRSNQIDGSKTYVFPGAEDDFDFEFTSPFGTEVIKAFASTEQFTDLEGGKAAGSLTVFTGQTANIMAKTRGINISKRNVMAAEASCVLTTVSGPARE